MPVTYERWLVLLSIVMAIQGAYVGLSLAVQIGDAHGVRRRLLLAGATASLAVAIWTMHFVGMLAVRLPFPVDYLALPTLLSFLVCAIVVGTAVYATSAGPLTLLRLTLSACLMGGGIFAMHYIGMNALDASALMVHDPRYVAASMAIAIAASGLALWLATGRGGRPPLILSAAAFGVAVSGMHYTAMTGVTLYAYNTVSPSAPALSVDLLAIVVAVVAFGISGIFLLLLLPETSLSTTPPRTALKGETQQSSNAAVPVAALPPASFIVAAGNPEFGQGTFSPLGGVGGPPRKFARQLPIERDGGTHFVAVDQIVAVHANAHYTYVFDGGDKLFCPLSIGEVESRLDGGRFVRVHRSHIVNIDRVVGYKRSGDNELVQMAGIQHYLVPVSRSRLASLKSRVATLTGASADFAQRRSGVAAQ
ncbi:MAG: MHYT domain-containing protein [Xanthobacteraceae bacterium]